jgi:hypothetical protein
VFSDADFTCDTIDGQPFTKPFFRLNHALSSKLISNDAFIPNYAARESTNSATSLNKHIGQCKHYISFVFVDWGQTGSLMQVVKSYNQNSAQEEEIKGGSKSDGRQLLVGGFNVLLAGLLLFLY